MFVANLKFQTKFFNFLFSSTYLSYCERLKNFLFNFSQENPSVFFLLIHTYFCILVLHFFFYLKGIWNLPVEYLYNVFNLLRIGVFPPIILLFVLNYSPLPPEITEATFPHLKKILENFFCLLVENTD